MIEDPGTWQVVPLNFGVPAGNGLHLIVPPHLPLVRAVEAASVYSCFVGSPVYLWQRQRNGRFDMVGAV